MRNTLLRASAAVAAVGFILCALSAVEMPILLAPMVICGFYTAMFALANEKEEEPMEITECATLEDCTDMYQIKGMFSVIEDGKISGFEYEKSTAEDGESEQCQFQKIAD